MRHKYLKLFGAMLDDTYGPRPLRLTPYKCHLDIVISRYQNVSWLLFFSDFSTHMCVFLELFCPITSKLIHHSVCFSITLQIYESSS